VLIGREPVDIEALEQAVADPAAGATVTFRSNYSQRQRGASSARARVRGVRADGAQRDAQACARGGRAVQIVRIAIQHRIGFVAIGETSVAISVSAAHRAEAFEACRFAIDRLKEVVPVWKKEYFEGGESVDRMPNVASAGTARIRPSRQATVRRPGVQERASMMTRVRDDIDRAASIDLNQAINHAA